MRSFITLLVMSLLAIAIFRLSYPPITDGLQLSNSVRGIDSARLPPALNEIEIPNQESTPEPGTIVPVQELSPYELHVQNEDGFSKAPGNGRHRGGSHVLMDERAVRFINDAIAQTPPSNETGLLETSPYGLWGTLGTRVSEEKRGDDQTVSSAFIADVPHTPSGDFALRQTEIALADHELQQISSHQIAAQSPKIWTLDFIELVSLHRFDEPVAYVEKELPSMNTIATGVLKTRPLNDFETNAINQLRMGAKLQTERSGHTLRMVGAILATNDCLACHPGNAGDLLGAFTYRFTAVVDTP
ncbi:hypothetical protein Rcae01_01316 [Novipirellula caenicola]|uniref:DUF3365 domain-containing protein n=2 Tax=Novipirellula caenicola TaxID=1536901 RepID=A0ABP9VQ51_9BACT